MQLAIVGTPTVEYSVVGSTDQDSWVVKVKIRLHAKWDDGEAITYRVYTFTTPRAIPKFEPGDDLDRWPYEETEEVENE